jgi:hypothetical protein
VSNLGIQTLQHPCPNGETDNRIGNWLTLRHQLSAVVCLNGDTRGEMHQTIIDAGNRQPHTLEVGPLTDAERLAIVRAIPSVAAKTLDEEQIGLLLANPATRNPLYLKVALEELRGFGSFTVRTYDAYEGRNPKTGEPVHVNAKKLPFFKVAKELKERVDAGRARHSLPPEAAGEDDDSDDGDTHASSDDREESAE